MAKTKTVNYTPELTAMIVERYSAVAESDAETRNACIAELVAETGKSARSLRAKLSRENVYVPVTPVSKVTGKAPAKKIEMAEKLRVLSGAKINPENVAKMNKTDIEALIEAFEALTVTEED